MYFNQLNEYTHLSDIKYMTTFSQYQYRIYKISCTIFKVIFTSAK